HDPRLREAEQGIREIARSRPSWSSGVLLEAQLAQRRQRLGEATDHYREAIELGEQRRVAYEQLGRQQVAEQRGEEMRPHLMRLGTDVARSQSLSQLAIPLFLQSGEMPRAEAISRLQVARRPDDPTSHIWRAQVQSQSGQFAEAEASLHRALEF